MKIAVLLAVRTTSKRLPHKVMRQIKGITTLEHTVQRLRRASKPDDVVVCTSTHSADDIIADAAKQHDWTCFRGSEDDVLQRFYDAAKMHGIDMVVRAQGDNMFVCPEHIDWMIDRHLEAAADWSIVDGLPWGMKSETISFASLERCHYYAEDTSTSEYLTWYFDQPQYFKTLHLEADDEYRRPGYRLTMDTEKDLRVLRRICDHFDKPPAEITTREIIGLLDTNPDIPAINQTEPDRAADTTIRARVNTRIMDTPRTNESRVADAQHIRMSKGVNIARTENLGLDHLPELRISEQRTIGDSQPVFVIAEIGQNHNGSVDIAKQLIDVAAMYEADAVKSAKRDLQSELTREAWDRPYEGPQSFGGTYGEHREALELSPDQHADLFQYCRSKGMEYFCSACDIASVEVMEQIGVNLHKLASRDITNLPLIERMAQTNKPIILSVGMATKQDLAEAMVTIRRYHDKIVVMQCTSEYPTPYDDCNLLATLSIRRQFNVLTGLSDHTIGLMTPSASVALGAVAIEKHLTLARYMKGTDHACSLEPDGLRRLVRDTRNLERALGNGEMRVPDGVEHARLKLARSLVSRVPIPVGTVVTEEMLCLKSPGGGLAWKERDRILKRAARRSLLADVTLSAVDFE